MRYEYQCAECGSRRELWTSVEERDNLPSCHGLMRRVFNLPIINANLRKDRPENKYANGFSETDRLNFMREETKQSDAMCESVERAFKGVKSEPESLADIYYGKV